MTFEEMKLKLDPFHAFDKYITVAGAKAINLIQPDFHEYFADNCSCGAEMLISMERTSIMCSDPRCPCKQALGLHEMLTRFGTEGIGPSICKKVYYYFYNMNKDLIAKGEPPILANNSYISILGIGREKYSADFLTTAAGNQFISAIKAIQNNTYTFSQIISNLALPHVHNKSTQLFDNINSMQELLDAIKKSGSLVNYCCSRGVYDKMVHFYLWNMLPDISLAMKILQNNVKAQGLIKQDVCITGSLSPYGKRMKKSDFIALCNQSCYTASLLDIVLCLIQQKRDEISFEKTIELCKTSGNYCPEGEIETFDQLNNYLETADRGYGVQSMEIKMTTAMQSVPFIIADSPSRSRKYLIGLERGEINTNGVVHNVLVTSEEYLRYIKEEVKNWNQVLMNKIFLQIKQEQKQETNSMNLF